MFQAPLAGRTTLIHLAFDANVPILAIVGYGLARYDNPIAVLLAAPWLLLTAVAFPAALALAEFYDRRRSWWSLAAGLRVAVVTLAVVALFGIAHYYVGDRSTTGGLFALLAVAMAVEVFAVRSITALRLRRADAARCALVVGAGWAGRTAVDCILREPRLRVRVAGFLDDDPAKRNVQYKGISVIGTGQRLHEAVAESGADLVIMAISQAKSADLIKVLLELRLRGVEVVDMPAFFERATGQIPIKNVEDAWFVYSGGFEMLLRTYPQRIKRTIDVVVSLAGLLVAAPLMGILALLVRLDSRGPVFLRQERAGIDERPFNLLKFRSVRNAAEPGAESGWAGAPDLRVTRVGRWLRVTCLDEVPQFINVLKGEMSCIGPRPERPHFVERLKKRNPYYALRFSVKPGLTGWTQVQYGYGTSMEDAVEMLKYDLHYIKNMSFALDAWIAFKTLKTTLFAQGT